MHTFLPIPLSLSVLSLLIASSPALASTDLRPLSRDLVPEVANLAPITSRNQTPNPRYRRYLPVLISKPGASGGSSSSSSSSSSSAGSAGARSGSSGGSTGSTGSRGTSSSRTGGTSDMDSGSDTSDTDTDSSNTDSSNTDTNSDTPSSSSSTSPTRPLTTPSPSPFPTLSNSTTTPIDTRPLSAVWTGDITTTFTLSGAVSAHESTAPVTLQTSTSTPTVTRAPSPSATNAAHRAGLAPFAALVGLGVGVGLF